MDSVFHFTQTVVTPPLCVLIHLLLLSFLGNCCEDYHSIPKHLCPNFKCAHIFNRLVSFIEAGCGWTGISESPSRHLRNPCAAKDFQNLAL